MVNSSPTPNCSRRKIVSSTMHGFCAISHRYGGGDLPILSDFLPGLSIVTTTPWSTLESFQKILRISVYSLYCLTWTGCNLWLCLSFLYKHVVIGSVHKSVAYLVVCTDDMLLPNNIFYTAVNVQRILGRSVQLVYVELFPFYAIWYKCRRGGT